FSRHDLTSSESPPGESAFDLVCCRNVLIYLRRDAQEDAMKRVRAAVADDGYLLLGEAEWPCGPVAATLTPRDRRTRLFKAAPSAAMRESRETTVRHQH